MELTSSISFFQYTFYNPPLSSMTSTTTYTLDVPATNSDILDLMKSIIEDVGDNRNTRVELRFGTSRLLARDEREREQYPDTVTASEALTTLARSMDLS